jgi:ferredoxin
MDLKMKVPAFPVSHSLFLSSIFILFLFLNHSGLSQCPNRESSNYNCSNCPTAANDVNTVKSSDEFKDIKAVDEFEEFKPDIKINDSEIYDSNFYSKLFWLTGIFLMTIIAGFLVRFKPTRSIRILLLLSALVILGFYRGGCPCMISSFQDVILAGIGVNIHWIDFLWFIGLIPITYIFGQVWCGWICHLGAFQEFLYRKNKFAFLKSNRSQIVMKIIRYALLAALIIQLIITRSNLFCKIDPFLVAFNLISVYTIGWILLGLLLISSLFVYRPFCRAACPIGLALGWIKKIPGASVLDIKSDCSPCRLCISSCDVQAINRVDEAIILDNKDCYLCGDCIESCKKYSIKFFRKGNKHKDVVHFKKN